MSKRKQRKYPNCGETGPFGCSSSPFNNSLKSLTFFYTLKACGTEERNPCMELVWYVESLHSTQFMSGLMMYISWWKMIMFHSFCRLSGATMVGVLLQDCSWGVKPPCRLGWWRWWWCARAWVSVRREWQDGDGDSGFWIIAFLNYKNDSLKEALRAVKRQILGFPWKMYRSPQGVRKQGEREDGCSCEVSWSTVLVAY